MVEESSIVGRAGKNFNANIDPTRAMPTPTKQAV